jgi:hypothetical protein
MVYNDVIEIVRSWHGFAQFLFFFLVSFFGIATIMLVVGIIGEFFTETLPVLVRGYPPCKKQDDVEEDNA